MYYFENRPDTMLIENYMNMGETNPNGEMIYLNNLYYTRNGHPFHPVMGEINIVRNPRCEWEDRILKLKAQGVNIIASYLNWINHEFYEGCFDFSGDNDIREFIQLCKKHDMYFALRIGPWITSECRHGGLPAWLYNSGIPLRENNEQYLFYVRRWYQAVAEQVKGLLFKNGGNIIILQIDNELTIQPDHIATLKQIAIDVGITVPLYTATGWNIVGGAKLPPQDVIPMFGGYSDKPWAFSLKPIKFYGHYNFSHVRNSAEIGNDQIQHDNIPHNIDYSKYPYSMCELGMGLCTSKHRRPYVSAMDNYAFALTKLGSGCNLLGYYVACGGINKMIDGETLNWDPMNIKPGANTYAIYNYDFQAAIGEHGACTDTHRKIKLINYFVNDFGAELAPMQPKLQATPIADNDDSSLRYAMRIKDGRGYIFVNHYCHKLALNPVYDVQFQVAEGMPAIPEKPIDVIGEVAFFFPFNLIYGENHVDYIMAQPYCKTKDTVFFKAISGIEPVYKFKGEKTIIAEVGMNGGFVHNGMRFVTLTDDEAERLYKFGDIVCIAEDCDLLYDRGEIRPAGYQLGHYWLYEEGQFIYRSAGQVQELAEVRYWKVENPDIDKRYQYELFSNRKLNWNDNTNYQREYHDVARQVNYYEITVTNPIGYVYIDYYGDSAQLYYDGQMSDDHFYTGQTWIIPAKHFYKKKVILAIAEYTHDIYVDILPKQNLGVGKICVKPM